MSTSREKGSNNLYKRLKSKIHTKNTWKIQCEIETRKIDTKLVFKVPKLLRLQF